MASPDAAFAQAAPPADVRQQAQQAVPTRDQIDSHTQQQAPRSARLVVEGDIERAPCALDAPAYADIRVTISAADFHNLQGMSAEELKASYAALLGPDKPISTICTIRDAAATALRRKGYLAAVQVPVQKIENGVVRFEVLFAKIVAIRVRGDAGKAEGLLGGYLKHLTDEPIFNRYVAERYLLLSRDLPGYEVRLSLKPAGTAPGELVGEVSVTHTPFEMSASVQNLGARTAGRWTGAVAAQAYGLLGGDRLTASVSSTADFKEQKVAALGYETKLGNEGLTVSGNVTYAWTDPDTPTGALGKLTARTLFATGELSYPVVRSQRLSLLASVGLDYLNQKVDLAVAGPLSRDRLRVGFVRLDWDAADVSERRQPQWRASGSVELRRGFDIFDASNRSDTTLPSRQASDTTATVIRGSATFEYSLGNGYWAAVMPRGQYGFTSLPSFEQFSAGNYSIGRGYDPGTITGDAGVGSAFELRLRRLSPLQKVNLAVQPFLFGDVAWTWNHGEASVNPDFLASAGGGFHAYLNNRFRMDGTIAFPLKAAGFQTHNHDPRFLVSLSTKLWPWGN